MKVSQVSNHNVSNISFKGKDENKENRYLKWVSQNQANNALLLVKDREERNAKFKVAESVLTLGGIAAVAVGAVLAIKHKPKAAVRTVLGGLLAATAALHVNNANTRDALKTADERGFTKESVNRSNKMFVSPEKVYTEADKVYTETVSK